MADLRLLCDELKSEAAVVRTEAASARMKASSAREQVASQAEEMQQRQLELGQVIDERDQSRSQAVEAVSWAEATERLAEASARAGALAESLAVAVGTAQSAQAVAAQQRAQAKGPAEGRDGLGHGHAVGLLLLSRLGKRLAVLDRLAKSHLKLCRQPDKILQTQGEE